MTVCYASAYNNASNQGKHSPARTLQQGTDTGMVQEGLLGELKKYIYVKHNPPMGPNT